MRRTASSFLGLVLAALAGATPAAAQHALITIRATSVLPDGLAAALHEVAQTTWRPLPAGSDPEELLQAHCLSVSNAYRRLYAEINAAAGQPLAKAAQPRTVQLPACPRVRRNPVVTGLAGEDLALLLRRTLGAEPDTPLLVCDAADRGAAPTPCRVGRARDEVARRNGGASAGLDGLLTGRVLRLPFASQPTTIILKPGWTVDRAIDRLNKAAEDEPLVGAALIRASKPPSLGLLGPIDHMHEDLDAAGCRADDPLPERWPFDPDAVRAAVAAVSRSRPGRGPVVVRVADTGITEAHRNNGFPEQYVRRNEDERNGRDGRDAEPRNGYLHDYHGISADLDGVLDPPRRLDDPWHGAEVAHLVLGGRGFRDTVPRLGDRVRVTFARLFTDLNRLTPMADPAALARSLTVWRPPPEIVNLSVGGPGEQPDLVETMRSQVTQRQQLLVVAAGNEGRDLAREMTYPAAYAVWADLGSFMLVVGAHGPTGEMTRFSNHGAAAVHLLAPGCRIPRSADPGDPPLAGTSFAAPLVSFTAAMIYAMMPEPSIRLIRERLWATARHVSDDLASQVAFGGVLDIPAALRITQDLIRYPDNTLSAGRWRAAGPVRLCRDAAPMDIEAIARVRVVPARGDEPTKLKILERLPAGPISSQEISCRPQLPSVQLDVEGGSPLDLPWEKITSFIPAMIRDQDSPVPGRPERQVEVQQALREVLGTTGPTPSVPTPSSMTVAVRAFQAVRQEPASGVLTRDQLNTLLRVQRRMFGQ